MAHFAGIDSEDKVVAVLVVRDSDVANASEILDSIKNTPENTYLLPVVEWIQTSYNTLHNTYRGKKGKALRGNYAGPGYSYDRDNDVFIPPKPFASWVLNPTIWDWEAPVPMPEGDVAYYWDEESGSWTSAT